jgi:hypothetical protein
MKLTRILTIALIAASLMGGIYVARPQTIQPHPKEVHLRNIRQLTFGGENAEAYFSLDGQKIIFQSTRDSYKCDQIFTMNRDGSNVKLVSTGKGRTTCGYSGRRIARQMPIAPKVMSGRFTGRLTSSPRKPMARI